MTPAAPMARADAASRPALLIALCDAAGAAAAIDLDAADGNAVATERIWIALRRLLERALELLAALQCAEDDGPGAEIGDVCFAGTMELRRVLRELIAAHDDGGRLVTAETGRRKMRRAIRAVLEAARATGVYDAFARTGCARSRACAGRGCARRDADYRNSRIRSRRDSAPSFTSRFD